MAAVILVDKIWLASIRLDMRGGFDTVLARVVCQSTWPSNRER
jgi:hypothetical protein